MQRTIDMAQGWAIWFTGLPASGKTTLARAVRRALQERGTAALLLDSDELRRILTPHATYAAAERDWFYGQLVDLAEWLARSGENVLNAATGSRRCYREAARARLGPRFAEVWVRCPAEICRARDRKGLYSRADTGVMHGLPGVDEQYEAPLAPELVVDTDRRTPEQAVEAVLTSIAFLRAGTAADCARLEAML